MRLSQPLRAVVPTLMALAAWGAETWTWSGAGTPPAGEAPAWGQDGAAGWYAYGLTEAVGDDQRPWIVSTVLESVEGQASWALVWAEGPPCRIDLARDGSLSLLDGQRRRFLSLRAANGRIALRALLLGRTVVVQGSADSQRWATLVRLPRTGDRAKLPLSLRVGRDAQGAAARLRVIAQRSDRLATELPQATVRAESRSDGEAAFDRPLTAGEWSLIPDAGGAGEQGHRNAIDPNPNDPAVVEFPRAGHRGEVVQVVEAQLQVDVPGPRLLQFDGTGTAIVSVAGRQVGSFRNANQWNVDPGRASVPVQLDAGRHRVEVRMQTPRSTSQPRFALRFVAADPRERIALRRRLRIDYPLDGGDAAADWLAEAEDWSSLGHPVAALEAARAGHEAAPGDLAIAAMLRAASDLGDQAGIDAALMLASQDARNAGLDQIEAALRLSTVLASNGEVTAAMAAIDQAAAATQGRARATLNLAGVHLRAPSDAAAAGRDATAAAVLLTDPADAHLAVAALLAARRLGQTVSDEQLRRIAGASDGPLAMAVLALRGDASARTALERWREHPVVALMFGRMHARPPSVDPGDRVLRAAFEACAAYQSATAADASAQAAAESLMQLLRWRHPEAGNLAMVVLARGAGDRRISIPLSHLSESPAVGIESALWHLLALDRAGETVEPALSLAASGAPETADRILAMASILLSGSERRVAVVAGRARLAAMAGASTLAMGRTELALIDSVNLDDSDVRQMRTHLQELRRLDGGHPRSERSFDATVALGVLDDQLSRAQPEEAAALIDAALERWRDEAVPGADARLVEGMRQALARRLSGEGLRAAFAALTATTAQEAAVRAASLGTAVAWSDVVWRFPGTPAAREAAVMRDRRMAADASAQSVMVSWMFTGAGRELTGFEDKAVCWRGADLVPSGWRLVTAPAMIGALAIAGYRDADGASWLVAHGRRYGQPMWRVRIPVARFQDDLFLDAPVVAEGLVLWVTGAGAVAAVDAVTGAFVWMRTHDRTVLLREDVTGPYGRFGSRAGIPAQYRDGFLTAEPVDHAGRMTIRVVDGVLSSAAALIDHGPVAPMASPQVPADPPEWRLAMPQAFTSDGAHQLLGPSQAGLWVAGQAWVACLSPQHRWSHIHGVDPSMRWRLEANQLIGIGNGRTEVRTAADGALGSAWHDQLGSAFSLGDGTMLSWSESSSLVLVRRLSDGAIVDSAPLPVRTRLVDRLPDGSLACLSIRERRLQLMRERDGSWKGNTISDQTGRELDWVVRILPGRWLARQDRVLLHVDLIQGTVRSLECKPLGQPVILPWGDGWLATSVNNVVGTTIAFDAQGGVRWIREHHRVPAVVSGQHAILVQGVRPATAVAALDSAGKTAWSHPIPAKGPALRAIAAAGVGALAIFHREEGGVIWRRVGPEGWADGSGFLPLRTNGEGIDVRSGSWGHWLASDASTFLLAPEADPKLVHPQVAAIEGRPQSGDAEVVGWDRPGASLRLNACDQHLSINLALPDGGAAPLVGLALPTANRSPRIFVVALHSQQSGDQRVELRQGEWLGEGGGPRPILHVMQGLDATRYRLDIPWSLLTSPAAPIRQFRIGVAGTAHLGFSVEHPMPDRWVPVELTGNP